MDDTALWAAQIAAATPLPDRRLRSRLGVLLESLAHAPADSLPQAAGSWADTKATYRFFDNRRVAADDLRTGVSTDTARRCLAHDLILAIQDTTSGNFTHRAIPELGPIDPGGQAKGLFMHTTLAATVQGDLLGVLSQQIWTRPGPGQPKPEQKESGKWLAGIDHTHQYLHETAEGSAVPRIIHVMDREGDAWDVFQAIDDAGDSAVLRCVQNRRVEDPLRTAHEAVRRQPLLGSVWVPLPRSHGRAAREARLEIRVLRAELVPAREKYPHAWSMDWTLVEAWESNPSPGVEPIHWLLWTREPAGTLAEAWEVVRIYTCRWPCEEFHLTLKSGCRIEDLQLQSWERLEKALTLYAAVAVRIVGLRDGACQTPLSPATVLLSVEECAVLEAKFGASAKGGEGLTLGQAVLWIGRLGGHLNRKGDGLPGVRTLWRGLRDLALLVEGFRAARRLNE